ncbi:MAG: hypothetical protein HQ551_00190 [Desulfobacteraceae bacterium]|nr:hypothetical protein [Desulfobacteraceae bacterium]
MKQLFDLTIKKILYVLILLLLPSLSSAREVVSILYFENTTKAEKHDWLHKGLSDMLITDISQVPQIKVVEREALEKILKEQALSQTGVIDENQAVQVGKLLNAKKLISGSYIVTGKKIRIDAKISDGETGIIAAGIGVTGKIDQIFELEKSLAQKILSKLSLKVPDGIKIRETSSINALRTYYEGVSLFDEGKIKKAKEKFLKAKQLDPLYLKPQKGLEAYYQYLKDFKKFRQQREIHKLYQFADQLKIRLETPQWKTYADLIMQANLATMSPGEVEQFNKKNSAYMQCNTPVQCTWRLMLTFEQIGQKSSEYFNDIDLQKKLAMENLRIAEKARKVFKGDPFLGEILYQQIMDLRFLKEFEKVKIYAEEFMLTYPDYRLIEFVEDTYQKALKALSLN